MRCTVAWWNRSCTSGWRYVRIATWDATLTRAVLGPDLQRGGPPVDRVSLLLSRGSRTGTKESYASNDRFVVFCTETLSDVYGWKPRCPLPATERTVILYLSHLSMEGLVKERSLNSYLSAINQAHEDIHLSRPALGPGLRLTRSVLRDVEGKEFDDVDDRARSVRAPVPADVIMAILELGLTTPHPDILRKCACIVLNYCWYNRADTGMQLKRANLSFDWHWIAINDKGKSVARSAACPVTHHEVRCLALSGCGAMVPLPPRRCLPSGLRLLRLDAVSPIAFATRVRIVLGSP